MALLTFPLARDVFSDKLRIQSMNMKLEYPQDTNFSGGGQIYVAELSPPMWVGEARVGILTARQAAELQGLFEVLDGSLRSFYLSHPLFPYPSSDYTGEILEAYGTTIKIGSIQPNMQELSIKDAPPGFEFPAGTLFHFDFGSNPVHRGFHRLVSSVTANGSGVTPLVQIRPHLQGGAVNTVLEFKKPALEVKIVPGSLSEGEAEMVIVSGMSFQFRQVI